MTEPLELRSLERQWSDGETADLRFDVYNVAGINAEMQLKWGPSPRQQRVYVLGEQDLCKLHEWLTKVLGLEE